MTPKTVGLIPILLALFLASQAPAAPIGDYDDLVNKFFDLVNQGKPSEAVDLLYKTNPWSDKIQDAIQQLKSSLVSTQRCPAIIGAAH